MAVVKNLMVRAGADFSGMRKEMQKARQDIANFKSNVTSAVKGIAGAIAAIGIGTIFKDATKSAMDVEAAVQQINRTMGTSAKAFDEWARDGAMAFQMGRESAIKYGAIYSNLMSTFTKSTTETMTKTQDLLKASAIVASSTGRSMQDVMERIRSGMLGNTEAIEDLGINVYVNLLESTKAFRQFAGDKSWDQLDFKTQQQIRYFGILEQVATKFGSEVRDNTSSRMMQFTETLKDVRLSLGQAFLPILNIVLPILTKLASALAVAMNIVAQFSQALFGKKVDTKATDAQAASVAGMGDAYEEAGKKASRSVAGFDEVNTLSESSGGAGSGSTGMASDTAAMPDMGLGGFAETTVEVSEKVRTMADGVKSSIISMAEVVKTQIGEVGSFLSNAFSGIGETFKPLKNALLPISQSFSEIGMTAQQLLSDTLVPMAKYVLGDFIPNITKGFLSSFVPVFADTAVWAVQELSKTFKNTTSVANDLWHSTWFPNIEKMKNAFLEGMPAIAEAIQVLLDGTLKPFVDYFLNGFVLPIFTAINETMYPIFAETMVWAFTEFARTFEWAAYLINDIYNTVIQPVFELLKTIVTDTLDIIKGLWEKHGETLLNNLSVLFEGVRSIFQKLWDEILEPIIKPFLEMLDWLWDKHLKGLVEQVGDFIMKLVNGALEIVNKFIMPLVDALINILGPGFTKGFKIAVDIVGSAIAAIADILKGIFKVLGGVIDFIVGVFTGDWRKAWQGVKDVFVGIFDTLWGAIKFPLNLIIDAVNGLISGLNGISFDLPDWVPGIGGKSFGINIPSIPKLKRGGIVDTTTNMGNYIAGEAGTEMIVPLENTSFTDKIASALGTAVMTAMQMSQGGQGRGGGDIVLQVDGTTFARLLNPYASSENNRIGGVMITTT